MKTELAKFYRFLESNCCLADYLVNKDDTFDIEKVPAIDYVISAFVWHESEKGIKFWSRINSLWVKELENNNV
jgi:hypothetical protein